MLDQAGNLSLWAVDDVAREDDDGAAVLEFTNIHNNSCINVVRARNMMI